jgi:hypothetical protein
LEYRASDDDDEVTGFLGWAELQFIVRRSVCLDDRPPENHQVERTFASFFFSFDNKWCTLMAKLSDFISRAVHPSCLLSTHLVSAFRTVRERQR